MDSPVSRFAQARNSSTQDIKQGQLPEAVQAITTAEWVRERVDQLAQDFAALGGPPRAAALITAVAAEG